MSEPLSKRSRAALVILAVVLAAGIGARLAFGASGADDDDDAPVPPAAKLEKGPDGQPALRLASGQADAMGLAVQPAEPGRDADTQVLHGVVLDPLPFLDLDAKRKSARAAFRAAQAAEAAALSELHRVEALHTADRDASDKALQEAQRAAADAAATRAAAGGEDQKAQAAWSQTGLDSVEGLADFGRSVVRLDLPLGAPAPSPMPKTLMATSAGIQGGFPLRVLGLAPGGSPLTGGLALLALASERGLRPGLPVDAALKSAPRARILVPRSAVIWHDGGARVFVESDNGSFEPRAVQIVHETGEKAVLESGLAQGDRIAVQGALALEGEYERLSEGTEIGAGGV